MASLFSVEICRKKKQIKFDKMWKIKEELLWKKRFYDKITSDNKKLSEVISIIFGGK